MGCFSPSILQIATDEGYRFGLCAENEIVFASMSWHFTNAHLTQTYSLVLNTINTLTHTHTHPHTCTHQLRKHTLFLSASKTLTLIVISPNIEMAPSQFWPQAVGLGVRRSNFMRSKQEIKLFGQFSWDQKLH